MNYCTIFDSKYLSRGLLCYESLLKAEPDCHLYIFCLDDECANILRSKSLVNCTILRPTDYEGEELLSIKSSRTRGEYAWTVKPFAITFVFSRFQVDECSYIDADLYFYSAPKLLTESLSAYSVVLTPHNFAKEHDTSESNGVYCGQFVTFRNDQSGNALLNWWKKKCFEWCYNRHEPGRFGDQKYLEHLALQPLVAVVNNFVLAAPWNLSRYDFFYRERVLFARDRVSLVSQPVVFYHFHGFKIPNKFTLDLAVFWAKNAALHYFYNDYANKLHELNNEIAQQHGVTSIDKQRAQMTLKNILRRGRDWLFGRYRLSFRR